MDQLSQTDDTWQDQLVGAFNNINDLCHYLQVSVDHLPILPNHKTFPLKVPKSFVDCMEKGNPNDPLLRQVLPLQQELFPSPGFTVDPVGDMASVAEAGILHKYHGRALLITTGACAIHCRYCFRRHFPYNEIQITPQRLNKVLTYLYSQHDITEIILSGGDPLLLHDKKLGDLLKQLEQIPHLRRIRIHTRLPVVLPARITPTLLDRLSQTNKSLIVVIHANHSRELSSTVKQACLDLKRQEITLFNQSVLLKGINDSAEELCRLSETLFSCGVLPYYLHLLDQVHGSSHFSVAQDQAVSIIDQVKRKLPGYLVPKLVKEYPGADSKTTIA